MSKTQTKTLKLSNSKALPSHLAIIVDGNRRWAKEKGLPTIKGHQKAANETIELLVYHCLNLGIPYLTFWVWSTENWKRGKRFAHAIFKILRLGLKKNMDKYISDGIRLNTIGDLSKIPQDLRQEIEKWKEKSKNNKKLVVTIALNYGGRDEIIRAINKLLKKPGFPAICTPHKCGGKINRVFKLTEKEFEKYLDTAGMPDPDLIIRTGGEQRLSGFMLWQAEYAEFYFTKTYFPDFTPQRLDKALKDYSQRQRRFGK